MRKQTSPPRFRKHTLALAISSLLCGSLASAHAANPPLKADGQDLVASGDYQVLSYSNSTNLLHAVNGGTITTSGLVNLFSAGYGFGLFAEGVGSRIDFLGGTIDVGTVGAAASNGGRVNISNASITTGHDRSSQRGGVRVMSSGYISVTNSNITASSAINNVDFSGASIDDYSDDSSRIDLTDTVIRVVGTGSRNRAFGINAERGSIVMNGGSITVSNTGSGGSAATASGINYNSYIELNNVDITTEGKALRGVSVVSSTASASAKLNSVRILTSGDQASGLDVEARAQLVASDTHVVTIGSFSAGAVVTGSNSSITQAEMQLSNSTISTAGEGSNGIRAGHNTRTALFDTDIVTTGDQADGIFAYKGATLQMSGGGIQTQGANSHGLLLDGRSTALLQGSHVSASGAAAAGVQVNAIAKLTLLDSTVQASGAGGNALSMGGGTGRGVATAQVSNSILSSANGAAIQVAGPNGQQVVIDLLNGTRAGSDTGVLLDAAADTQTSLAMNGDVLADGDIVIHGNAVVNVSLANRSRWAGATSNLNRLTLDTGGQWQITGSSDLHDLSNAGAVGFVAPAAGDYKSLTVRGNYSGSNGVLTVNTVLNEGGALANQHTDRLLVEGNATGTTLIEVKPTGSGALTDLRQNGQVNADEGISIVQVGGDSHADAFALKGGYVAAGPWQYTLHAFGPGEADPSQSLLPGGKLNWDYRLGNTFVCEGGCGPEEPEKPGEPEEPELPHPGRIVVVPQIPSYLVAPTALFNYGSRTLDTLHQRLGELRNTAGKSDEQLGGEVFARVLGGQLKYRTDLSFNDYGYDFEQQMSTLQAGGSLVKWNGKDSTLRAGWAVDLGTTRVTPQAADGDSHANYTAYGVSGWLTWQQASGMYVDAVLGAQRFSGDVSTTLRGSNVAKIHADMWTASLEVGYPFAVSKGWSVEPQAQVTRQWLNFKDFNDADGLATHIAPVAQTTGRAGVRVAKTDEPKFAPYLRADLIRSFGARPQVTVASETWNVSETFSGGRIGASYRIGAGASSQFANNVSLYGETTYQHGTGSAGLRGWGANAGVRWNF